MTITTLTRSFSSPSSRRRAHLLPSQRPQPSHRRAAKQIFPTILPNTFPHLPLFKTFLRPGRRTLPSFCPHPVFPSRSPPSALLCVRISFRSTTVLSLLSVGVPMCVPPIATAPSTSPPSCKLIKYSFRPHPAFPTTSSQLRGPFSTILPLSSRSLNRILPEFDFVRGNVFSIPARFSAAARWQVHSLDAVVGQMGRMSEGGEDRVGVRSLSKLGMWKMGGVRMRGAGVASLDW